MEGSGNLELPSSETLAPRQSLLLLCCLATIPGGIISVLVTTSLLWPVQTGEYIWMGISSAGMVAWHFQGSGFNPQNHQHQKLCLLGLVIPDTQKAHQRPFSETLPQS